jgi:proline iminopeptidase
MGVEPVAQTVEHDPSIPHVTIDGVTFHAEAFGDPANEVVIVVHGGPGGDYRALLDLQALSDEYYVVFYDQRGTGLSPRVDAAELTLESAIEDLDRIVQHYGGGEPVSIVGHSWGAMLASAYIGRYPEKVGSVVMAEPGALTAEAYEQIAAYTGRMDLGLLARGTQAWFESLHIDGPDDQAAQDHMWGTLMSAWNYADWNGYNCPGTEAPQDHAWRASSASSNVVASASDGNGGVDLSALHQGLGRYQNDVLLMVGECNTWIGLEHQEQYHVDLFQEVEVVVIPDAGHDMFFENPADSVSVVRAYLDS